MWNLLFKLDLVQWQLFFKSDGEIVAEVNVPSYPVISFIIFYQVKWQGKDASMGELPIWAVYSSTGIAFWYFLWYYNPRIVIWIILLIQWYIIFLLSSYIFYSSCILWACNGSSTSNLTEICSMHKIVGLLHCLDLVFQHDWFDCRLEFYSNLSGAMTVLFQIWQRNVCMPIFLIP